MPSCQSIYEKNPNAKSGAYWLMVNGVRFKVCHFTITTPNKLFLYFLYAHNAKKSIATFNYQS